MIHTVIVGILIAMIREHTGAEGTSRAIMIATAMIAIGIGIMITTMTIGS